MMTLKKSKKPTLGCWEDSNKQRSETALLPSKSSSIRCRWSCSSSTPSKLAWAAWIKALILSESGKIPLRHSVNSMISLISRAAPRMNTTRKVAQANDKRWLKKNCSSSTKRNLPSSWNKSCSLAKSPKRLKRLRSPRKMDGANPSLSWHQITKSERNLQSKIC